MRILSCSAVFGMFNQQKTQTQIVPNLCSSAYLIMDTGGIVSVQETRLYHPSMSSKQKAKTINGNQAELFPPNWADIHHSSE